MRELGIETPRLLGNEGLRDLMDGNRGRDRSDFDIESRGLPAFDLFD
jgi:hypothetical protein